jgi:hypothetical protein
MRVVLLMSEFKPALGRRSSLIFNRTLTMWIGGLRRRWNDSAKAEKSRKNRGLARCGRRATLEKENLVAPVGDVKIPVTESVSPGQ